jgi:hypothetical protein
LFGREFFRRRRDPDHSVPATQTFDVSPKFLKSIKVAYADGDFQLISSVTADPSTHAPGVPQQKSY